MIRCNLSSLMKKKKLRIANVARETGLNRSAITALCRETSIRIDLQAIDRLCAHFHCQVGDLFEYVDERAGGGL
jgi:putative transcriptional regulator